jgi:hypothetical protein
MKVLDENFLSRCKNVDIDLLYALTRNRWRERARSLQKTKSQTQGHELELQLFQDPNSNDVILRLLRTLVLLLQQRIIRVEDIYSLTQLHEGEQFFQDRRVWLYSKEGLHSALLEDGGVELSNRVPDYLADPHIIRQEFVDLLRLYESAVIRGVTSSQGLIEFLGGDEETIQMQFDILARKRLREGFQDDNLASCWELLVLGIRDDFFDVYDIETFLTQQTPWKEYGHGEFYLEIQEIETGKIACLGFISSYKKCSLTELNGEFQLLLRRFCDSIA